MIKINLARGAHVSSALGSSFDGAVNEAEIRKQGLLRLLIILMIPMAMYAYEFQMIPELKSKLNSKKNVLQSLIQKNEQAKGAVSEIKKFKEDQAHLQKQIDTLEGLRKERSREVKILDGLQRDIPEKVWLTKIDFQPGRLSIEGMTTADLELSSFMESLSRSIFLKEVNLIRSVEATYDGGVVKKFEVSCALDIPVGQNPAEVRR
ncbi:MAG: fimbrial assembly protein [Bdellovibrio sp. CG10_big_fil_rev_8_21_14_0_10_47_8]|nr:MAG: fimbrial assembly protein [Bdellovibrio sp. CG10_big_fil_rev_8_21_14_0_10_47_8]